jgi:Flp pilus assembly protein TadB
VFSVWNLIFLAFDLYIGKYALAGIMAFFLCYSLFMWRYNERQMARRLVERAAYKQTQEEIAEIMQRIRNQRGY